MEFGHHIPAAGRIEVGTLCIVIKERHAASLIGTIVTVVDHVDRPTARLLGDHVIETRHGDRYITWRANLQPIRPGGKACAASHLLAEVA